MATKKETLTKKVVEKVKYLTSVGRRKSAVVRMRLYVLDKSNQSVQIFGAPQKAGTILLNKKPINEYFVHHTYQALHNSPLKLTGLEGKCVITATLSGGGVGGQLEAYTLALSRALQKYNHAHTDVLRASNLLTVDARVRERRKVGTGGKSRRAKQSPKR